MTVSHRITYVALVVVGICTNVVRGTCTTDFTGLQHCTTSIYPVVFGIIAGLIVLTSILAFYRRRARLSRLSGSPQLAFINNNVNKPPQPHRPPSQQRPQSNLTHVQQTYTTYNNRPQSSYVPPQPPQQQQQYGYQNEFGYSGPVSPPMPTPARTSTYQQPTYPPPASPPVQQQQTYPPPTAPPPTSPPAAQQPQTHQSTGSSSSTRWSSFNPYNQFVPEEDPAPSMPMHMPTPSIPSQQASSQPSIIPPPPAHNPFSHSPSASSPHQTPSTLTSQPSFSSSSNTRPNANSSAAATSTQINITDSSSPPRRTQSAVASQAQPTPQVVDSYSMKGNNVILSPSTQDPSQTACSSGSSSSQPSSQPQPQLHPQPQLQPQSNAVSPPAVQPGAASPPPRVTSPDSTETYDPPPRYSEFEA